MVYISGNAEADSDPLEMVFVVKDTKDFDKQELSQAVTASALRTIPLNNEMSGPWETWVSGRFRKLLRRAKPSLFDRIVSEIGGKVVIENNVAIFATSPLRKSEVVSPLSRSQVSGLTVLDDKHSSSFSNGLTIFVNDGLGMSPAKGAIAAAHAAQLSRMRLFDENYEIFCKWRDDNYPCSVQWVTELPSDRFVEVYDAGLTEVVPGSLTALSVWEEADYAKN